MCLLNRKRVRGIHENGTKLVHTTTTRPNVSKITRARGLYIMIFNDSFLYSEFTLWIQRSSNEPTGTASSQSCDAELRSNPVVAKKSYLGHDVGEQRQHDTPFGSMRGRVGILVEIEEHSKHVLLGQTLFARMNSLHLYFRLHEILS